MSKYVTRSIFIKAVNAMRNTCIYDEVQKKKPSCAQATISYFVKDIWNEIYDLVF